MTTGADELLDRLRSKRGLPPAVERKRIREAAGASLRDLASALHTSHTAVAGWEAGATPREHYAAYARLLEELRRVTAP
jgi:transcriptional regulator with XRE-family HTH domain